MIGSEDFLKLESPTWNCHWVKLYYVVAQGKCIQCTTNRVTPPHPT